MITRLTPSQAVANWDHMKEGVKRSLPPTVGGAHEAALTNILQALMAGSLYAWVVHDSNFDDNVSRIKAVALTTFLLDPGTMERSLLIYSLFAIDGGMQSNDWIEGIEALRKFARGYNCTHVAAYSAVTSVVELAKRLGGDVLTRYIKLEV